MRCSIINPGIPNSEYNPCTTVIRPFFPGVVVPSAKESGRVGAKVVSCIKSSKTLSAKGLNLPAPPLSGGPSRYSPVSVLCSVKRSLISCPFLSHCRIAFRCAVISGIFTGSTTSQFRFKSKPYLLKRTPPLATPSGSHNGKIFHTIRLRSCSDSELAASRVRTAPSPAQELPVSQLCCRNSSQIVGLPLAPPSVIVHNWRLRPSTVLPITSSLKLGLPPISSRNLARFRFV